MNYSYERSERPKTMSTFASLAMYIFKFDTDEKYGEDSKI